MSLRLARPGRCRFVSTAPSGPRLSAAAPAPTRPLASTAAGARRDAASRAHAGRRRGGQSQADGQAAPRAGRLPVQRAGPPRRGPPLAPRPPIPARAGLTGQSPSTATPAALHGGREARPPLGVPYAHKYTVVVRRTAWTRRARDRRLSASSQQANKRRLGAPFASRRPLAPSATCSVAANLAQAVVATRRGRD
jgi:hypothetical protein